MSAKRTTMMKLEDWLTKLLRKAYSPSHASHRRLALTHLPSRTLLDKGHRDGPPFDLPLHSLVHTPKTPLRPCQPQSPTPCFPTGTLRVPLVKSPLRVSVNPDVEGGGCAASSSCHVRTRLGIPGPLCERNWTYRIVFLFLRLWDFLIFETSVVCL